MTIYTTKVTQLYTQTIENNPNYVVTAYYETIGVDGEYSASLTSVCMFSTADVTTFIPYADLTEDIVLSWIAESLGEDGIISIQACIQGQIDSQINPPVSPEITPLPW
jgi:hypothetical protein